MKQFDLTALPKLTRAELDFQKRWPRFNIDLEIINAIVSNALTSNESSIIDLSRLQVKTARVDKREKILNFFDDKSVHIFGTFTGSGAAFALSTPKTIAKKLVYSLLGAHPSRAQHEGRLSHIEQGIFSFIVASVARAIQSVSSSADVSIRLASFDQTTEPAQILQAPHLIEMSFELGSDQVVDEIRLVFEPDKELFSRFTAHTSRVDADRGLSLASAAPVALAIGLGEASILAKDLEALQVDNILMLDKTSVRLNSAALTGLVQCYVGKKKTAKMAAQLFTSESGQYAIQLGAFVAEMPDEH